MRQTNCSRSAAAAALFAVAVAAQTEPSAAAEKPLAFAWPVPASATVTKNGEKQGNKARLRYRLEVTAGPAAAAAMQRLGEQPGAAPFPTADLEAVRAQFAYEVITDPRTLRPLRASRTKTARVKMKGSSEREQVERSDYAFEWLEPAAAGR